MTPITIIDSIRKVHKGQWNELAEDNFFASHGWLLTVEESILKELLPIYFLYQREGRILGAAVCYLIPKNLKMIFPDDLLFGRANKIFSLLGISFMPVMVCYPLFAYGKHFFLNRDLDLFKKKRIAKDLFDSIEQEAKQKNLSLSFPRVLPQEKILIKQLCQRGYFRTLDLPQTYMDIYWDSFDGYKKHIRKRSLRMKKNIVQEINKNRKSGVTIDRVKNLNSQERRLYKLLNENSLKYNKLPMPFHENFLSRLKKNIGDDLIIYKATKKGRISGVLVMLKYRDTVYLPFSGIDHSLALNDFTYFNICFYRPIADAINNNIKTIYYGAGPYYPKLRRGCKIQKAYFFHKPCYPASKMAVKLWFCLHQYWYHKKLPQPQDSV